MKFHPDYFDRIWLQVSRICPGKTLIYLSLHQIANCRREKKISVVRGLNRLPWEIFPRRWLCLTFNNYCAVSDDWNNWNHGRNSQKQMPGNACFVYNSNCKLQISTAPTKAKSRGPTNSHAFNKINRLQRIRSWESGRRKERRLWRTVSDVEAGR